MRLLTLRNVGFLLSDFTVLRCGVPTSSPTASVTWMAEWKTSRAASTPTRSTSAWFSTAAVVCPTTTSASPSRRIHAWWLFSTLWCVERLRAGAPTLTVIWARRPSCSSTPEDAAPRGPHRQLPPLWQLLLSRATLTTRHPPLWLDLMPQQGKSKQEQRWMSDRGDGAGINGISLASL